MEDKLQGTGYSTTVSTTSLREDAVNKLHDVINACEAHKGKRISVEQADTIIANANDILVRLQQQ
jgi:hypothetical protein